MKTRRFLPALVWLLAELIGLMSACAPIATEPGSPLDSPSPLQTPRQTPSVQADQPLETPSSPQVAALVEKARKDLSQRLQIAVDRTSLRSVEAVQWRNSSLGCPMPGMQYLMVITPGYLIRLEAAGTVYEYHASETHVVYCDRPERPL